MTADVPSLSELESLGELLPVDANSRQAILTNYFLGHSDATDGQAQKFLAANYPELNSDMKHIRWARNRLRNAIDEARRTHPDTRRWQAEIQGNRTILRPSGRTARPTEAAAAQPPRPPSSPVQQLRQAANSAEFDPTRASARQARPGFAREAEAQAKRLAEELGDSVHGVKCWHSAMHWFDQGADRAFIGINPGGGGESEEQDRWFGYLELPYSNDRYNAWLDERWQGKPQGEHKGQKAARQTFQAMYGEAWSDALRNAACFDVVPFRTPNVETLPARAWELAVPWFQSVLEQVRPRLVICNGNNERRSPWAVISKLYGLGETAKWPIPPNVFLKEGVVLNGPLMNARVIGLPSIHRFAGVALFRRLERLRPFP